MNNIVTKEAVLNAFRRKPPSKMQSFLTRIFMPRVYRRKMCAAALAQAAALPFGYKELGEKIYTETPIEVSQEN